MRILLANEARHGGGGVETYLASLPPALTRRGHEVALLYANASTDEGPTRISTRESWSVADLGLDGAIAKARAWRPDVCFSHNMRVLDVDERLADEWPTFKMMHGYFGTCVSGHKAFSFPRVEPCTRRCGAGCLAYYLPRRCGQLRFDVMTSQYSWAMRQQRLFNHYAGVVVASDHMRREYLRYPVSESRVHTIPLFAASSGRPRPAEGSPIDVLFLGRMTALKGADVLVRAAKHAASVLGRPLTIVLAGEGPERAGLEALARESGSGGSVAPSFPGWVGPDARAALLSRAALVAVPSIWPEPFGLVGLEAAEYGVPAVAFDVGGIREWLRDGVNGCLADVAGGATALGDALASVLADPSIRARLSAGALAAARRFTADAHITALEFVLTGAGDASARSGALRYPRRQE
jgi:glycosyltransferase involved in cell wall biosynthesis